MKKTLKDESIKFNREEALKRVSSFFEATKDSSLKFELAGSVRRKLELVGDIDLIAKRGDVLKWAWLLGKLGIVPWSMGERNIDFSFNDISVNIRFFDPSEWGAGMMFLTGSKEFNIKCRVVAQSKGLMLNQYDILKDGIPLKVGRRESSMFEALGMEFVPPENR